MAKRERVESAGQGNFDQIEAARMAPHAPKSERKSTNRLQADWAEVKEEGTISEGPSLFQVMRTEGPPTMSAFPRLAFWRIAGNLNLVFVRLPSGKNLRSVAKIL